MKSNWSFKKFEGATLHIVIKNLFEQEQEKFPMVEAPQEISYKDHDAVQPEIIFTDMVIGNKADLE